MGDRVWLETVTPPVLGKEKDEELNVPASTFSRWTPVLDWGTDR
jgi:hypothetical protein